MFTRRAKVSLVIVFLLLEATLLPLYLRLFIHRQLFLFICRPEGKFPQLEDGGEDTAERRRAGRGTESDTVADGRMAGGRGKHRSGKLIKRRLN